MIEIAIYKGTTIESKAIRFFTRSQYSHCGFWINKAVLVDIQNNDGVVWHDSLSDTHPAGIAVDIFKFTPELSKVQEAELINILLEDRIRKFKYDYGMVFKFVPVVRIVTSSQPDNDDKREFFCSEHIVSRCAKIGAPLFRNTQPFEVPPDWLARSERLIYNRTEITK